jgi:hypothetical protein
LTTFQFYSKLFIMANVTATPAGPASAAAAAAAAAKLKAAKLAAKALRNANNADTAKYFAAGMVGIMAFFTVFHWMRFCNKRYSSKGSSNSKVLEWPIAFTR